MKTLKEKLKGWNKEVFGIVDLKIDKTVEEINALDNAVAIGGQIDVAARKLLNAQFWNQLHTKESLLSQKSRSKWILEGDANTRYFHLSIQARRRRNQPVALKVRDEWIERVDGVKVELKRHFEQLFSEADPNRPTLDGIHFPQISEQDNVMLTAPFTCEEIREAVWNCDGNKSPGPDGFSFNFFKSCWEIIKEEVSGFV